ncbi:hypothetical protein DWF04_016480 [Cereibacter sphaeroides f. sp. denitrificans]|nr:hypothetical protein DWF04_22555 [Cereibacter sphaeroides f. sp. denitrificans]
MRAEDEIFTVGAMAAAARTILTAYDAHMAGGQGVPDEVARRIATGAAFGAAAFEEAISEGQDAHAMLRATLLGIIDPADPGLDYLRAGNRPAGPTKAAADVLAERARQISAEGWTPEHDDTHQHGQIAGAALCYLAEDIPHWARQQAHGCYWPWDASWWKPTDHRRNLVKAGALILAEIERLDRAEARARAAEASA